MVDLYRVSLEIKTCLTQRIPSHFFTTFQHPNFMMLTSIYLLFGLALTAMCINIIQVRHRKIVLNIILLKLRHVSLF